jgi:hypothetical protein
MSTDRFEPGEDELLPPVVEPQDDGWVHVPHPDRDEDADQPYGSYQVLPELDAEDGPPPRRGGPTS